LRQFPEILFVAKLDVAVIDELYFDSCVRDFGNFSPVHPSVNEITGNTFSAFFDNNRL
jgi:hypothetical protein